MKFLLNGSIFTGTVFLLQSSVYSNGELHFSQKNGLQHACDKDRVDWNYLLVKEHGTRVLIVFQTIHGHIGTRSGIFFRFGQAEHGHGRILANESKNIEIFHRFQRSLANGLADIARFVDKSPIGHNYTVYVDDTMTRLIFRVVTFNATPSINVTKPTGEVLLNSSASARPYTNGSTITTLDIPVSSPADYGNWSFTRQDANTWDMTVQGESTVTISHEFFELGTDISLEDNLLLANKRYRLMITVSGRSEVQSVEFGQLFAKNKIILQKMLPFTNNDQHKFEIANTSILSQTFYVGIEGKDNSNNTFIRIDPTEINPVLFHLDVSPDSGAQIYENSTMRVTFTFISYKPNYIKVSVNDTMGLVLSHTTDPFLLKAGENITGTFVLQAGDVEGATTVTIIIKQYMGGVFVDGPMVQRTFTVVANDTVSYQHSKNNDSPQSRTPTAAIAGGVSGALLVLIAVVIGVIVYKKVTTKRNSIRHKGNMDIDMPRNTKYSSDE